jgi:hypothetical protein
MATKNQTKNTTTKKIQFFPTAVFRHGIALLDGNMLYTDGAGRWLFVSEDGADVRLYYNLADVVRDVYKKSDGEDIIVAGWNFEPHRFTDTLEDAYRYYNEHFD